MPLDVVRKAVDASKSRFKPEAVTYLSRSAGEMRSIQDFTDTLKQEDLRDLAVQEELITEYITDFQPDDETLKKIFDVNKKYNAIIENGEEIYRNVNWKLKKLEWSNLFNYGESNCINFENLNGIVGIFGKNFSGKSSIIDALLYTVFNTTSKNNRKNLNIINQNKEECRGYVEIDIGTKTYKIERISTKYKKKLKGKQTLEAKTDLEFVVVDNATQTTKSLNGISRIETDKNIRKIFGSVEDFLMTSMTSQLDSLAYINEGSTRRKEILAKFLDLEFFEKKFKMAKEDTADFKGAIRNLSNRNYDEEIKESRTDLARLEAELSVKNRTFKKKQEEIEKANSEYNLINEQIESIPSEFIDIKNLKDKIKSLQENLAYLNKEDQEKNTMLEEQRETHEKIKNFINNFDIESFNNKKQTIEQYRKNLLQIDDQLKQLGEEKLVNERKIDFLKNVPCGYREQDRCFFVKDARVSIEDSNRVKIASNQLSLNKKTLSKKINEMDPLKVEEYLKKYQLILEKQSSQKNRIVHLELECEKNSAKIMFLKSELSVLSDKEEVYEENKETIENLQSLLRNKKDIKNKICILEKEQEDSGLEMMELYKSNGSLEQKLNEVKTRKQEFCELENQFTVTDLYMRCMHPNGISYDIIKKRLPIINDEISKILTNIVDFEIFFENDEKKLDILIKHPKHEPRPIEMGSGAEKTIAAVAIRLALLNVTTLPKGDIFILDEPGTALDADNMEGFIRILDMIKSHFKTVLLISHLDSLKDVVDRQIIIEKKKGLAYVNE